MMRTSTLPYIAVMAFAFAGCAHNGTSANSIVGTWKIAGGAPHPAGYMSAISGARFAEDGTGEWMSLYQPMVGKAVPRTSKLTWTDLGGGRIRIVERGTAQEYKDDITGSQLVLTPPAGMFGTSGIVFERVK